MGRKKTRKEKTSSGKECCEVSSTSVDDTMSTMNTTTGTTVNDTTVKKFTKAFLQRKMEEMLEKVEEVEKQRIAELEGLCSVLRSSFTPEQLRIPVKLEKIADIYDIMNDAILDMSANDERQKLLTPATVLQRRRRSRSAALSSIQESPRPKRSSSVGLVPYAALRTPAPSSAFKTPMNRLQASRLMSESKYTVRRPMGQPMNPPCQVKRVMRAGEEAISTAGSPLFVQGRVPSKPEINIPLQNGVILNIDPDNANKKLMIPELDPQTKEKLKLICEKLQKCLD